MKNNIHGFTDNICDMINGNESDVGNIDFELQAKRGDNFLCFTLFWTSQNYSYLLNQMSDWNGVWIKMQQFNWTSDLYWKIKIEYCWLVTHSPSFTYVVKSLLRQMEQSNNSRTVSSTALWDLRRLLVQTLMLHAWVRWSVFFFSFFFFFLIYFT